MVGSSKEIETLFNSIVRENGVEVNTTNNVTNYTIHSKYDFDLVVEHDLDDGMYSFDVLYPNKNTSYNVSSYDEFKEYTKKKTHKLFAKKDFEGHLKAINGYVNDHLDIFFETNTVDVYFDGKMRGFSKIII